MNGSVDELSKGSHGTANSKGLMVVEAKHMTSDRNVKERAQLPQSPEFLSTERRIALSRWDNDGGAGPDGPQEGSTEPRSMGIRTSADAGGGL